MLYGVSDTQRYIDDVTRYIDDVVRYTSDVTRYIGDVENSSQKERFYASLKEKFYKMTLCQSRLEMFTDTDKNIRHLGPPFWVGPGAKIVFIRNTRANIIHEKIQALDRGRDRMKYSDKELEQLRTDGMKLLEPDRKTQQGSSSHQGYVCPLCGSGTGPNGTGMSAANKDKPQYLTCWACREIDHADIFEIIGRRDGISTFPEQIERVAELLGYQQNGEVQKLSAGNRRKRTEQGTAEDTPADYTEYYKQTNARLAETDYHRGISLETLNRYHVGYDPAWRHPKVSDAVPMSPRLIIPTSASSYLARDTRPDAEVQPEAKPYTKSKVGKVHNFNEAALSRSYDRPVFVVESELDALSIIDVGGVAVGLGGVGNVERIAEAIQSNRRHGNSFIIWTDADKAGQKAAEGLQKKLVELSIPCAIGTPLRGCKDANEALMADRAEFEISLHQVEADAMAEIEKQREQNQSKLQAQSSAASMDAFVEWVKLGTPIYPTGFRELDALLDGGLQPGLTCIGSISSGGKTTLTLQIADHVAEAGDDVLYFSLEMGRNELIAKSLSRLTMAYSLAQDAVSDSASTTREIMNGRWYTGYSKEKLTLIQQAEGSYRKYAQHLYIHEGVGEIGVNEIHSQTEQFIEVMGTKPLIVIDYLQILAPAIDPRASDKQNVDKAVLELKRMARDLEIPILVVTSYNRANYDNPVNMASAKESGGIEYVFDTILGLQQDGMDYQDGESDAKRTARVRKLRQNNEERFKQGKPVKMQVKVLKQRNGVRSICNLNMWAKYNYFEDVSQSKPAGSAGWKKVEI